MLAIASIWPSISHLRAIYWAIVKHWRGRNLESKGTIVNFLPITICLMMFPCLHPITKMETAPSLTKSFLLCDWLIFLYFPSFKTALLLIVFILFYDKLLLLQFLCFWLNLFLSFSWFSLGYHFWIPTHGPLGPMHPRCHLRQLQLISTLIIFHNN